MAPYTYVNINEDGVAYNKTTDYVQAQELLEEFPNDTIMVFTTGSPWEKQMKDGEYL